MKSSGQSPLTAAWARGAEFKAYVRSDAGATSFFVPVEASMLANMPAVGEVVSVQLVFRDREAEFHVHGRVVDVMRDGATGVRLEFLPEERERQELVLACAEGESIPYLRRKAVRTPADLEVHVRLENGETLSTRCTNISERGTHLALQTLRTDQRIGLVIVFPGKRRASVNGRVTSSVSAGPQRGAGIEFLFASKKERDAFAAEVDRVRKG
jgi:hypothetical protein